MPKLAHVASMIFGSFLLHSGLAWSSSPRPPLILPFAAHQKGTALSTDLQVQKHRIYIFYLRLGFKKNDIADRNRVEKLFGSGARNYQGKLIDTGISIPLKLSVVAINEAGESVIYAQEIQDEEPLAAGAGDFTKKIENIDLKPGHYRIRVEALTDVPELAKTPLSFGIGWYPKSTPID